MVNDLNAQLIDVKEKIRLRDRLQSLLAVVERAEASLAEARAREDEADRREPERVDGLALPPDRPTGERQERREDGAKHGRLRADEQREPHEDGAGGGRRAPRREADAAQDRGGPEEGVPLRHRGSARTAGPAG